MGGAFFLLVEIPEFEPVGPELVVAERFVVGLELFEDLAVGARATEHGFAVPDGFGVEGESAESA